MKNRSKGTVVPACLGLEKRHLISMIFKELSDLGFRIISAGVLIGALFDKLGSCLLLKLMKMKVQLVSTFQPDCGLGLCHLWSHLWPLSFNAWRSRLNALCS